MKDNWLKLLLLGLVLLSGIERSLAQTNEIKKYLKIGDTIPDIPLKMFNHPDSMVKPSDFRGKLLILDFWATWCASCVANLPKLEKLQNEFEEQIQIVPIALHQSKAVIDKFYEQRRQRGMELNLPSVVDDSLMASQYYFETIPLVIWVNEKGVVIAITDSGPVNTTIIQKILDGEELKLPLKYFDPSFEKYKPYLSFGNGGSDTAFTVRSMFTPYNAHIRGTNSTVPLEGRHRVFFANRTALNMYRSAYREMLILKDKDSLGDIFLNDYLNKRIVIESENEKLNERFPDPNDIYRFEEYKHRNWFCYELIAPDTLAKETVFRKAIADLDFFWQTESKLERRNVKCLALTRIDGNREIIELNPNQSGIMDLENDSLQVSNLPTNTFCRLLTFRGKKLPIVIDETDALQRVDIKISFDISSGEKDDLNRQLVEYNLVLVPREYEMEMLILRDKPQ